MTKVLQLLQTWQEEWSHAITHGIIRKPLCALIEGSLESIATRVSIYRHSIFGGKINSLKKTFAALTILLGEEEFEKTVALFLKDQVSVCADLHAIGADFCTFLKNEFSVPNYCYELAQFEWTWHQVFQSKYQPAVSLQLSQRIAQEDGALLTLMAAPSLIVLSAGCDVAEMWRALIEENYCPLFLRMPQTDTLFFALVQQQGEVRVHAITENVAHLLASLKTPMNLEDLVTQHLGSEHWVSQLLAAELLFFEKSLTLVATD